MGEEEAKRQKAAIKDDMKTEVEEATKRANEKNARRLKKIQARIAASEEVSTGKEPDSSKAGESVVKKVKKAGSDAAAAIKRGEDAAAYIKQIEAAVTAIAGKKGGADKAVWKQAKDIIEKVRRAAVAASTSISKHEATAAKKAVK